jgi:hypothetical protein
MCCPGLRKGSKWESTSIRCGEHFVIPCLGAGGVGNTAGKPPRALLADAGSNPCPVHQSFMRGQPPKPALSGVEGAVVKRSSTPSLLAAAIMAHADTIRQASSDRPRAQTPHRDPASRCAIRRNPACPFQASCWVRKTRSIGAGICTLRIVSLCAAGRYGENHHQKGHEQQS